MKKLSISVPALSFSVALGAQPTFENIYISSGSYMLNLIELPGGNVLTTMGHNNTVNVAGMSIIAPDGAILYTRSYAIDTFLVVQSVRKFSENLFFVAGGYYKDQCSSNPAAKYIYPVVCRMDSLGNFSDAQYYVLNSPGCPKIAGDLEVLSDQSVVAWGREYSFNMLKLDASGQVSWAKNFLDAGRVRFVRAFGNGDLLVGFETPIAGASLARLDADGNFIWCKSYMRPLGRMHDAIVESDSSFIITGFTSTSNAKLFMMELDGDGEVQWCRGYGSGAHEWYTTQWSQLERTIDGNYAVLATLGQGGFFFRPFLMKTDLNGDTLWSRSMGADGYIYHTSDLLVASDGGYVFSGIIWGNLPEMNTGLPFIFKADSLGHFSCLSRSHPVQLYELFPTDSSFTLASVDGATAHPAYITDTTSTPINVYDACEVANAVLPYPERIRERMHVRPNPNTGRFTVQFTDPLMAESYYSVYDGMGKLLFQRPLPKGRETEEVDLSRFGAGTYVVRFTDKEGSCYERVVVE